MSRSFALVTLLFGWLLICGPGPLGFAAPAEERRFLGIEVGRLQRLLEMGYNLEASFETEVDRLERDYPDSLVPDLLRVGKLYWVQEYKEYDSEKRDVFEEKIADCLDRAAKLRRENRDDPDAVFLEAMVQLLEVKHLVDLERYWAAFWRQRRPMRTMERLLEEYPEYHDAKMALGLANCYLSKAPGMLKVLARLMRYDADMERGLRYLREGKEKGTFVEVDCAYYLAGVYFELLEDPAAARSELAGLAERFPRNPKFQVRLSQLDRGMERHQLVIERLGPKLGSSVFDGFSILKLEGYNELIWSLMAQQRHAAALEAIGEARALIRADPRHGRFMPWSLVGEGEALRGLGRKREALAVFEKISDESPQAFAVARARLAALREAGIGAEGD